MSLTDLEKQSEELEQTLKKQFQLVKKDSDIYLKIAGIALVTGLATFTTYRLTRGKKAPKSKKKKKKSYSFISNLRSRFFWMLLDIGKRLFIERMNEKMLADK